MEKEFPKQLKADLANVFGEEIFDRWPYESLIVDYNVISAIETYSEKDSIDPNLPTHISRMISILKTERLRGLRIQNYETLMQRREAERTKRAAKAFRD